MTHTISVDRRPIKPFGRLSFFALVCAWPLAGCDAASAEPNEFAPRVRTRMCCDFIRVRARTAIAAEAEAKAEAAAVAEAVATAVEEDLISSGSSSSYLNASAGPRRATILHTI